MKAKSIIALLSALLAVDAIAEPLSHFRLEPKIVGKAEYTEDKSNAKTQTRKVEAVISNWSDNVAGSTVVRWKIYGHKMVDHELIVIEEGEEKVSIPANGKVTVTSPEIKVTGNREYSVTSRSRSRGGKSKTKVKKMPAAGMEYHGYAVEVYADGKLATSYYSKASIEKDIHPEPE